MIPENPLEQALIAASTEPDARALFYRLVLESPLFVIDDNPKRNRETGTRIAQQSEQLTIIALDLNGVPHTPIFSSVARIQHVVTSERQYVSMVGRDLLATLRGSHLILNPGSDFGKQFVPDEVDALLDGSLLSDHRTITVNKPTEVVLGQPAEPPTELINALRSSFETLPVQAAYLAHCLWPESDEPAHTVVGIQTNAVWDELLLRVVAAVRRATRSGEMVDLIQMDDSAIAEYMRTETRPFYTKRKRFFFF